MGRARLALGMAVAVVLVTIFLRDALLNPTYRPPFGDLLYFYFLWNAGATTWRDFGQAPFWNPFHCGGMVELGNVHSMAWSPFFLPALALDVGTSIRLFIWLHILIAFVGMWLWARRRGLAEPWAFAPAIAFAMCGFFPARAAGHLSFLPFAWVPWLLLLHERAQTERRWAFVSGALVALCLYTGAPYPTTFGIVLIAALVGRDFVIAVTGRMRGTPDAKLTRPIAIAVLAGLGFVLIAAFKLFPTIEYVLAHPREIPAGDEALGPGAIVDMLLYRPFTREHPGYTYPFDEYRDYVGPIVVLGALLTLLHGRARGRDLALVAVFLALLLGDHGPRSPYALLHQLPGYASQRVPARFLILALPFVGLWFGQALADVAGGHARWRRIAAGLALVAAFVDLATANPVMLRDWFTVPPETAAPQNNGGKYWHLSINGANAIATYVRAPLDGIDFKLCEFFEPNPPEPARELQPLSGPIEFYPFEKNDARLVRFTPNRVVVDVTFTTPADVVLNENYYPGWTSEFGPAHERGGRAAFALPAGTQTVTLTYRPQHIEIYAAMTVLGLIGLFVAISRRR